MLDDDLVCIGREGPLLRLTLNRPAKANALTAGMLYALAQTVQGAEHGDLIVMDSASPRLFCAGADIAQFVSGPEALAQQEHGLLALVEAMSQSRAPVIAIARGRAAGAGAILLALADVVLAADDLQIAAPEFGFGMYPVIVEAVLQSRLWPALASRLCLGAGSLGASEALALGMVAEVLPTDGFATVAAKRLDYYASRQAGLQALGDSRRASAATAALRQQLATVAPMMMTNFEAPGVRERIGDYLEGLRQRAG
ncbi:enoyl-CoA hydratase/isomerase family protein [Comamonas humi]